MGNNPSERNVEFHPDLWILEMGPHVRPLFRDMLPSLHDVMRIGISSSAFCVLTYLKFDPLSHRRNRLGLLHVDIRGEGLLGKQSFRAGAGIGSKQKCITNGAERHTLRVAGGSPGWRVAGNTR